MTGQRGFLFDADRCVMCRACELACKGTRNVELGVHWRKVVEIWEGQFPNVTRTFISISCLHCAEPPCRDACPTGAISKRTEDGIVVVDGSKCSGCQECYAACPHGVPQFGADSTMQKCDLCVGRGGEPPCAAACPADALFFGKLEDLTEIAGKKGTMAAGFKCLSMMVLNPRGREIRRGSLVIPPHKHAST